MTLTYSVCRLFLYTHHCGCTSPHKLAILMRMNLLALDTTQGTTSLALCLRGQLISEYHDDRLNGQSADLAIQADRFLQAHHTRWQDMTYLACTTGTGGFTSVRIGVAFTRGAAFASGTQAVGVSLPQIMAHQVMQRTALKQVTCLIPAGKRDVTMQSFYSDKNLSVHPSSEMELIQRSNITLSGNNTYVSTDAALLPLHGHHVAVSHIARYLAEYLLCHPDPSTLPAPVPLYAKPPDAAIGTPLLRS